MRVHVEGVRLDDCKLLYYLERSLRKLEENTVEALTRTPPTITSRQLLEENLQLVLGARLLLEEAAKRFCREE